MKIIQTPVRFYPYIGGAENYVYYLSVGLARKGHEVKVICADEPKVGNGNFGNVVVERLPYLTKIANTNITLGLPKRIFLSDGDIIHTHFPTPWSADISAVVARLKNKPLFLTYYNDITGTGANKIVADFYNFTALKLLLAIAKKIFVIQKNYIETSPFLKPFRDKIVVAVPGVDLKKFRPIGIDKKEGNTVLFVSSLDKFHVYKGLDYLLLSIKKITRKIKLKLYIVGTGELLGYYQQMVKDSGIENYVNFLGFLSDDQLLHYYNLCDVFVLPTISSVQEGFGMVVLEAMACKKPVIVTDIVGVSEDVKVNNAGIVVRSKDDEVLCSALEYVLSNKDEGMEMGRRGYDIVKSQYTWERLVDAVEYEYMKA